MDLIIAEKPSVALDIGKALSADTKDTKNGYIKAGNYIITWAFGHLVEIDDVIAPKEWAWENLPIIPEKFDYKVIAKKQFDTIKNLLKEADRVIIATDAGREGELIARLILYKAGWKKWESTYRFWTSEALTKEVVLKTLKSLRPAKEFDSLYYAGLARMHADWIVGINFTRATTLAANDGTIWSVGRVQTPTLQLIYERDEKIKNFKPVDYYLIKAIFKKGAEVLPAYYKKGKGIDIKQEDLDEEQENVEDGKIPENGFLKYEDAKKVVDNIKEEKEGLVVDVYEFIKTQSPPPLHSLTTLQKEASDEFGYSANQTLQIAQNLYETHKCISYPRTDSNYLAESTRPLVKEVLKRLGYEKYVDLVDKLGSRVFNDKKLTDHHAIIPLQKLPENASREEKNIYSLILRRFLGPFYGDYQYKRMVVLINVKGVNFQAKLTSVVKEGWTSLYGNRKKEEVNISAKKGDKLDLSDIKIEKQTTKPPPKYKEGDLVSVMEAKGLGTPATRANILETIKKRGYVDVSKGRIEVSAKGVELLNKIPVSEIKSPQMTALWEEKIEKIDKNKLGYSGYSDFINEIKQFVMNRIDSFKNLKLDTVKAKVQSTKIQSTKKGKKVYNKNSRDRFKGGEKHARR